MIRIITKRGDNGVQEEWTDYPDREIGEVPTTLALRFDAELYALKVADLSLGVKRWTEAAFKIRRFKSRAYQMMQELFGESSEVPADERGEALEAWVADQPDYLLAQQVGIWSAVNMGGGRMTLMDVLALADRDVEDIEEPPPFIDDDGQGDDEGGDEGKA